MSRLRRPGSPWRILVHDWIGRAGRDGLRYGKAHHVTNDRAFGTLRGHEPSPDTEHSEALVIEGTEFDELVVGRWIHLEQMNQTQWWMNVGGVTLWVTADRDGRPVEVAVYGPDDYAEPVEGCAYKLKWTFPGGMFPPDAVSPYEEAPPTTT